VIRIIDVSSSQNPIYWAKVRAAGYEYAIVKLTEGATEESPTWKRHAEDAAAAGLKVGYYHYAWPGDGDAEEEAHWFLEHMRQVPTPQLVPWLDLEEEGEPWNGFEHSGATLSAWSAQWLAEVTGEVGGAGIYGGNTAELLVPGYGLAAYSYWTPHYVPRSIIADCQASDPVSVCAARKIHRPKHRNSMWPSWDIWQWTSRGRVPGIEGNCDLNVCRDERLANILLDRPVPFVDAETLEEELGILEEGDREVLVRVRRLSRTFAKAPAELAEIDRIQLQQLRLLKKLRSAMGR